jgi:hypothetical protein
MEILCIADIHGDIGGVKAARKYAEQKGIKDILILGDFPKHGVFDNIVMSMEQIKQIMELLKGLNVHAIPGNCDPQNTPGLLEEYSANFHEKVIDIEGLTLVGFGGSNITPFGTPSEYSENEIYERLKKLMPKKERVILAVHCPPSDTECDKTGSSTHAGSSAIRRIIEEFSPDIALCSHIHEAGGSTDTICKTKVANIGRLASGRIGIIEVDKDLTVRLETMA